jgi:integrase
LWASGHQWQISGSVGFALRLRRWSKTRGSTYVEWLPPNPLEAAMAWLQRDPSGNYHISFRFGGRKFKRSLRTKDEPQAEGRRQRLDENIRLVESGRLEIPPGADAPAFLLSDGKLDGKIVLPATLTLEDFFQQFFGALPAGSLEESTLYGMQIHRRHLLRHLGKRFPVQRLSLDDLQRYVEKRSKEKGIRGRKVGAATINKEVVTFRSIWNWAVEGGKLTGAFPRKGLRLPKIAEKPPFQTWAEIEQQIEREGLKEPEQAELWDCLFLTLNEVEDLLKHVKSAARHPFVYPMFVMAAHTGARRSELLRSQVSDFDGITMVIRERKRVRGKKTTRRVPASALLQEAIAEWMKLHPGGRYTFCQTDIARSKKARLEPQAITPDESNDHFKRTLAGSKWEKLRGWHCLRHSFISNCASKGLDQRLIDGFVGHTSEAMRRRYLHLFPESQRNAINLVFG